MARELTECEVPVHSGFGFRYESLPGRAGASRGLIETEIMKPTLLYRIASGVFIFIAANHIYGLLTDNASSPDNCRVRSIVYSLFAFLGIPGLTSGWPGSKESSYNRGLGVELFHGSGSEPSLKLDVFFPGSRGSFRSGGPFAWAGPQGWSRWQRPRLS